MSIISPNWPAPITVRAYTTTRQYGLKEQNSVSTIAQLTRQFNLPHVPIELQQIHGSRVVELKPCAQYNLCLAADASFTRSPDQICMVRTADCLPILICNQLGTQVAAIHAGWRGLAQGIIEATLEALNLPPLTLLAWLGPAIGPKHFIVGADVYDLFQTKYPYAKGAFLSQGYQKWQANLYQLATLILQMQGVAQIYGGEFCTYSQNHLFFSYRRDPFHPGRMMSFIWIRADMM